MTNDSFDPYYEWLGIQPHEHPFDLYRLLGLARFEADKEVISNAVDSRMAHVRSFQTGKRSEHTQPILNELSMARRTLLHKDRKAEYDESLQQDHCAADEDILPPTADEGAQAEGSDIAELPPTINIDTAVSPTISLPSDSPTQTVEQELPPTVAFEKGSSEIPSPDLPPQATPSPKPQAVNAVGSMSHRLSERGKPKKTPAWMTPVIAIVGVVLVATLVWAIGSQMSAGDDSVGASAQRKSKGSQKKSSQKKSGGLKRKKGGLVRRKQADAKAAILVHQEGNGRVTLKATFASLIGDTIEIKFGDDLDVIENWTEDSDYVHWDFNIAKPGNFRVYIEYDTPDSGGGLYGLLIDGDQKKATPTRRGRNIKDEQIVMLNKAGTHSLQLRGEEIKSGGLMNLKSVRLVPITN